MIENLRNAQRRSRDRQRRALNAPRQAPALERHEEASRGQGLTGTVTTLKQNYGFIHAGNEDYFFHRGAFENPADFSRLTTGDLVMFEPAHGKKGPRAESITRL